jgi:hypothetical protein
MYFRSIAIFNTTHSHSLNVDFQLTFFLKINSNFPVKESSSWWMLLFPWQSWISFLVYILHYVLSSYPNIWNIPHTNQKITIQHWNLVHLLLIHVTAQSVIVRLLTLVNTLYQSYLGYCLSSEVYLICTNFHDSFLHSSSDIVNLFYAKW